MELDELNRLEEKVKLLVGNLKQLKEENHQLKEQIGQLNRKNTQDSTERMEIKKKVTSLIDLIESIETESIENVSIENESNESIEA